MPAPDTRNIVMLAYEDAQILDVVGPLEVFSRTSRLLVDWGRVDHPPYSVEVVSEKPGPICTSSGINILAERSFVSVKGGIDTLFITGGIGFREAAKDVALLNWIRRESETTRRLGSICTGSFILAAAGILNGKRATTHWAYCDELSCQSDNIDVDKDAIFLSDGKIYTSAGVTTGMDMALAMVEEDWGAPVALRVAKELVLYQKRPGEEHQISRHLHAQLGELDSIAKLQEWILDNLDKDLSIRNLAERAALSERHLSRLFLQQAGLTPGKYVDLVRVEAAQRRLQNGTYTLKRVAELCGFSNEEAMRKTFHRIIGTSPNAYRSNRNSSGRAGEPTTPV